MTTDAPTLGEVAQESAADTMRAILAEQETETNDDDPNEAEAGAGDGDGAASADGEGSSRKLHRDERGRFASREDDDPPDDEPAGDEDEGGSEEEAASSGAASAGEVGDLEPPAEWSLDEQNVFRSLPEASQKFVLAQHTAATEARQSSAPYQELDRILEPRRQNFRAGGMSDAQAIEQLFALSDMANRDPAGFIRYMAQNNQLRPDQIWDFTGWVPPGQQDQQQPTTSPQQAQQPQPYRDPRIDEMERFIRSQQAQAQAQARQAQQQQVEALTNEMNSFKTAVNEDGSLSHPYFEQVRDMMAALYDAGRASDLQTAYDMACRADPEVSAKIEAARAAREQREKAREQKEKAAAAKKAGSSVSGTPGERTQPQPSGDLREDMKALMAERGLM